MTWYYWALFFRFFNQTKLLREGNWLMVYLRKLCFRLLKSFPVFLLEKYLFIMKWSKICTYFTPNFIAPSSMCMYRLFFVRSTYFVTNQPKSWRPIWSDLQKFTQKWYVQNFKTCALNFRTICVNLRKSDNSSRCILG